ncbi:MAG: hypothetical protein LN413_06805 [Candidatus Thermoplasmatota archaeon]|nr:hypothetical protein [Candidatus Thermoplasmatota archaeon]
MSLLVTMAREATLAKVAQRVRPLSRGYVERWIGGEFSLADQVVQKHANDIRAYQDLVLQTMDSLTVEELLRKCEETRPDLGDLWGSDGANQRLAEEWHKARAYVAGL